MVLDVVVVDSRAELGVHPRDRGAGQLQCLVDEVGAEVDPAAAPAGRLAAPGAGFPRVVPGGFEGDQLADRSLGEGFPDGEEVPVPAPVLKAGQEPAAAPGRRHHAPRLFRIEGHRLVGDDVLAGGQRGERLRGVQVVRGRQHHEVDPLVGEGVLETGEAAGAELPDPGVRLGAAADDAVEVELRDEADQVAVELPSGDSETDDDGVDGR